MDEKSDHPTYSEANGPQYSEERDGGVNKGSPSTTSRSNTNTSTECSGSAG